MTACNIFNVRGFGLCFSVIGHVSDGGGDGSKNTLAPVVSGFAGSTELPPLLLVPPRKNSLYIDKLASPNVTALLGKTAYLNCRVKNLGDKTVSTSKLLFRI
jgi:hypothetical protein